MKVWEDVLAGEYWVVEGFEAFWGAEI